MAENVIDQIVAGLRTTVPGAYPERGELRNVRVVGHTPKTDHYIYDVVVDFAQGNERIAAKVYRASKCGSGGAVKMARAESANLNRVYELFSNRNLSGVPRPMGDFSHLGAVAAEKFSGLPLQSIIMKAALLPGYADRGVLAVAARAAGEWLRNFHKVTADSTEPFDGDGLLEEIAQLCASCKGEGLDDASVRMIVEGARSTLGRGKKALPASAVLCDFTPLNVVV